MKTFPPPTPGQLKVENAIREFQSQWERTPSMQELADELGVSKVTVFEHIKALEKKGRLIRTPHAARSIILVGRCPACGCEVEAKA